MRFRHAHDVDVRVYGWLIVKVIALRCMLCAASLLSLSAALASGQKSGEEAAVCTLHSRIVLESESRILRHPNILYCGTIVQCSSVVEYSKLAALQLVLRRIFLFEYEASL